MVTRETAAWSQHSSTKILYAVHNLIAYDNIIYNSDNREESGHAPHVQCTCTYVGALIKFREFNRVDDTKHLLV